MAHAGRVEVVGGRQAFAALAGAAIIAVKQLRPSQHVGEVGVRLRCLCGHAAGIEIVGRTAGLAAEPRRVLGIAEPEPGSAKLSALREFGSDRSGSGGGGPGTVVSSGGAGTSVCARVPDAAAIKTRASRGLSRITMVALGSTGPVSPGSTIRFRPCFAEDLHGAKPSRSTRHARGPRA